MIWFMFCINFSIKYFRWSNFCGHCTRFTFDVHCSDDEIGMKEKQIENKVCIETYFPIRSDWIRANQITTNHRSKLEAHRLLHQEYRCMDSQSVSMRPYPNGWYDRLDSMDHQNHTSSSEMDHWDIFVDILRDCWYFDRPNRPFSIFYLRSV